MGITPERLTRPSVGFMPTTELTEAGQTIEPSVSVPTATAARLAATATAEPELELQGDEGIPPWSRTGESEGPGGGQHLVGGVDVVFEQDWHAVQWTARPAGP